ncbi:MAG: DUF2384 domain-containing protein [Polyangiaceae bacterium]|nr:DUF2384 domain-containing protein [Polyangiaceae bacterium]
MAPDGRLLHISEVKKGLACGCVCPSCSGKLIANKGPIKTHHFAHHSDRNCVAAYETMLHMLGKQVIADQKQVMLPPVVAKYKGCTKSICDAVMFTLDEVVIEPDMGGMRPDILGRRRVEDGTKELFIEVAVTHPCEPEKKELIRERKVAAIEIDLSKVPGNASQEEMEQAIITTAPRIWLFNAREENAKERLQAEFERMAAEDLARELRMRQEKQAKLDAQAERLAESFRTIRTVPLGTGSRADQDLVDLVLDTSLRDLVGIQFPGNVCFAVAAQVWQVAILDWLILDQRGLRWEFETAHVLKQLRQRGLVRRQFADDISVELADAVRIRQVDFNSPRESVDAYLSHLAAQRIINQQSGRWHRNERTAKEAQMLRARADGRHRVAQLEDRIKKLGGKHGLDVAQWMRTQHSGLAGSPAALAMAGGGDYDNLDNHLRRLERMREFGAYPEENLLGLPLEKEQQARREEQRLAREKAEQEREERARKAEQEREERARKAAEEAREANARRRQVLIERLVASAGESEVEAWIDRPLQSLGGVSIKVIEGFSEDQERAAYSELMDERKRRNEEWLHKLKVNELQETLRKEARRYRDEEWVDFWMRAANSFLKNQRPLDVCIDKAGLERCREALKVATRKRRG